MSINIEIPTAIVCPEGDIFDLPSKADLVNALNSIGSLPMKLRAAFLEEKAEKEKEIKELWDRLNDPNLTKEEKDAIIEEINALESSIYPVLTALEEEIEEMVEEVEKIKEKIEELLSPYWQKDGQKRNWQQEANQAVTKFLAEFHVYVPAKIAEFISKFVPINFTINVYGISIDIIAIITSPNYKKEIEAQIMGSEIVKQIQGLRGEIENQHEELRKLKDDPIAYTEAEEEAIKAEIERIESEILTKENLRAQLVDKLFSFLPSTCRQFDGEYGVLDVEAKAQLAFQCIQTEIEDWLNNWHVKAFEKLIDLFDEIWDLLGLPDLPFSELADILSMDIPEMVHGVTEIIKEEFKKTRLGIQLQIDEIDKLLEEEPYKSDVAAREILLEGRKELEDQIMDEQRKFQQMIRDEILGLSIFGFTVREIIGAEIESTAQSLEEEIADMMIALEKFKVNWYKRVLFLWVKKIKKFLDKIGLGKIFDVLFLSFCDFLELIGFLPLTIGLSLSSIDGVVNTSLKKPRIPKPTNNDDTDPTENSFETDGVRDTFPIEGSGSNTYVFIDGVRQSGGFTESSGNVVFSTPPEAGKFISVFGEDREFAADGQTDFNVQGGGTMTANNVDVFIRNKLIDPSLYTIDVDNQIIQFTNAPNSGLVSIQLAV